MEVQKKKIVKKDLPAAGKITKSQEQPPRTVWHVTPEDAGKSRWNPSALYF